MIKNKNIPVLLSLFLVPVSSHAAGGFTWVSSLIHKFHLPVAEHVLTFALTSLLLVVLSFVYRGKLASASNALIPDYGFSFRNLVESYGNFIMGQCKAVIGEKDGPEYFSFVGTIFIVIFVNNMIGLIPGILASN